MKTKPIACWAVVYDEKYDNGADVYLPQLFGSRSDARSNNQRDPYPKGQVVAVVIREIKRK